MSVTLVGTVEPPMLYEGGGVAVLKDCIITYNAGNQWDVIRKSDFTFLKHIKWAVLTPNLPKLDQPKHIQTAITGDPFSNRFFYVGNDGYVYTAIYDMAANTINSHTKLWLISEIVGTFNATLPLEYPFLIGAHESTFYVLHIVENSKIFSLYKRKLGETVWTSVFIKANLALTSVTNLTRYGGGMGVTGPNILVSRKYTPPNDSSLYVVSISGTPSIVSTLTIPTGNPSSCGIDNSGYLYANSPSFDKLHKFGMDSTPNYFKANRAPNAPSNLKPSGKVGTLTPKISWDFSDPDPGDTQREYEVMIRNDEDKVIHYKKEQRSEQFYTVPANILQSNTSYSFTVKVWDQMGEGSPSSAAQKFEIRQAPNPPSRLSPFGSQGNPEILNTLTPLISWKFTDPDLGDTQGEYEVTIRNEQNKIINRKRERSNKMFYIVPANILESNTTYHYSVKVWDQTGEESSASAAQYFEIRQPPNAPSRLSPSGSQKNPDIVRTLTPTISWYFSDPDSGDEQSAYEVVIWDDVGEVIYKRENTIVKEFRVPANRLRSNTTYHYTVKVWDKKGKESAPSEVQYFKIRQAPNAPSNLSPFGSWDKPKIVKTLAPEISWDFSDPDLGDNQSAYQVIIWDETNKVIINKEEKTDEKIFKVRAGDLRSNTPYHYIVKVWDQTGEVSTASDEQYFEIRQAPKAPSNLSPSTPSGGNPVIVPKLTPKISWKFSDPDPGDKQSKFQIILWNDAREVIINEVKRSDQEFFEVPSGKLQSNTIYYYTVKVWDKTGEESPTSDVQFFKTRQAPIAKPTKPLGSDKDPGNVSNLTPIRIEWDYIDLEGLVQKKFQVKIFNVETSSIAHDSDEKLVPLHYYEVQPDILTPGVKYYWTVKVWNENIDSDPSKEQYFIINDD